MGGFVATIDYAMANMLKDPSGFLDPTLITMTYNEVTGVISIYSSTGIIQILENRKLYSLPGTIGSPLNIAAHTLATGSYWLVFSNGSFAWQGTVWTFDKVQVAKVIYDTAQTPKGFFLKECHDLLQWQAHQEFHEKIGTTLGGPVVLTGYTLLNTTDAGLTFAIPQATIDDEDLHHTLAPLADAGPYTIFQRVGAAGVWNWSTTNTIPFLRDGSAQVLVNQFITGSWVMTAAGRSNNDRINYYVAAVPNGNTGLFRFIIIPGQVVYNTNALAVAESFSQLSLGTLLSDLAEIFVFAQVTFRRINTTNSYIETIQTITGSAKTTVASALSPSNHQTLSNRNTLTQHQLMAIEAISAGKLILSQADGGGSFNLTESVVTKSEVETLQTNVGNAYKLVNFNKLGVPRADGTDAHMLAYGTTAQRPGLSGDTDIIGMIRYNSELEIHETYRAAGWACIGHRWSAGTLVLGGGSVFVPPNIVGAICSGYTLLLNLTRTSDNASQKVEIECEQNNSVWEASIISVGSVNLASGIVVSDTTGEVTISGVTGTFKAKADGFIY